MFKHIFLGAVFAGATATVAMAQTGGCAGKIEIVRTDSVKPGMMDAFRKAVRDHQAWYTAHGRSDRIMLGIVLAQPAAPGAMPGQSASTAMTIHTDISMPPPSASDAMDPAWKAYVAEYDASSSVLTTSYVCVVEP